MIQGTFSKLNAIPTIINLGSLPSSPGIEGIFNLGVFAETYQMDPIGTPITSRITYRDYWGTEYTTANFQISVQAQVGINLMDFALPASYLDPTRYKILERGTSDSPTSTGLYRYFSEGSNSSSYREQMFKNINTSDSEFGKWCVVPKAGADFGFKPFVPKNDLEVYQGVFPFEQPPFLPIPPLYVIGSTSNGALYFYSNTSTTDPIFTIINFQDIFNNYDRLTYGVPKIRQEFDVLWWRFSPTNMDTYVRYFVDIVPIV